MRGFTSSSHAIAKGAHPFGGRAGSIGGVVYNKGRGQSSWRESLDSLGQGWGLLLWGRGLLHGGPVLEESDSTGLAGLNAPGAWLQLGRGWLYGAGPILKEPDNVGVDGTYSAGGVAYLMGWGQSRKESGSIGAGFAALGGALELGRGLQHRAGPDSFLESLAAWGKGGAYCSKGVTSALGAWSIATGQTGLQSTWQHGVEAGFIALWAGRRADARGLTCHMGTGLRLARRGSRRRLPRARGPHEQIQSHPWIQSCSVGAGGCELPAERRDSGGPTSRPPCPPSGAQVEKSWGRCPEEWSGGAQSANGGARVGN